MHVNMLTDFYSDRVSSFGVTCGDRKITSWSRLQRPSGHLDASILVPKTQGSQTGPGLQPLWCQVSHQRPMELQCSEGT